MKNKALICFLSTGIAFASAFGSLNSNAHETHAANEPKTFENRMHLTTGSSLFTYKGYQRYEGWTFTLDENKTITPTASDSLVLKLRNNKLEKCGYTFFLNNPSPNVTQVKGTSTSPTYSYLHKDDGSFIQTISHGSYGTGYYIPSAGSTNYSYVSIPLSNFNGVTIGNELTISSFTIGIRLKGVADSDIKNASSDASLFGAYLCNNFTAEGELDIDNLTKIYTPGISNFTAYDSGNSGITADCIGLSYEVGSSLLVNSGENGEVKVTPNEAYIGNTVKISCVPEEGYGVETFKVNGVDKKASLIENLYEHTITSDGLTVDATFYRITTEEVTINTEHGTVVCEPTKYNVGDDIVIKTKPDTGYELSELKVNGVITETNRFGQFLVKEAPGDLVVDATFKEATEYKLEEGSKTSIYNHMQGTVWADFDAINVSTSVRTEEISAYEMVGITTSSINKEVTATQFIAVNIQNLDAQWRTFYVDVNGQQRTGEYYIIDRLGNVQTKSESIVVEKYTRFENVTWDLGDTAVEGFTGTILIPISNYDSVTEIENISVYTGVKNKSNARFNIGSIYLVDSFDKKVGYLEDFDESQLLWKPSESNFNNFGSKTAELTEVRFLKAHDLIYGLLDKDAIPDPSTVNYDTYYATLPQNMINEDGYVNWKQLGIKGIAFDVNNQNAQQVQFAIRVAGKDNNNLTNTEKTLWQTSIASGFSSKVIYKTGLVRTRIPGFLPFDESGSFEGSAFIPFSNEAFTNISNASGGFPEEIQPVIRFLFKTDIDDYKVNLSNIRFVTDDSEFKTNSIILLETNGTILAKVGESVITNNANNNVLDNTLVDVTFIAQNGYDITEMYYTDNDGEHLLNPSITTYQITVNSDTVIFLNCEAKRFTISYDLDGGENNLLNPDHFNYGGTKIILEDPTKEGFKFVGWFDADGNEVTEISCFTLENVSLKAVWEKESAISTPVLIGIIAGASALVVAAAIIVPVIIKKRKVK